MWTWDQSAGKLYDKNGDEIAVGYSGYGEGKNNPAMQFKRGIGPVPRGIWKMTRVYTSENTGPYTIELCPMADTQCFGRSAFRIHGDSIKQPGSASHGCIILTRTIREKMYKSGDMLLKVVE